MKPTMKQILAIIKKTHLELIFKSQNHNLAGVWLKRVLMIPDILKKKQCQNEDNQKHISFVVPIISVSCSDKSHSEICSQF